MSDNYFVGFGTDIEEEEFGFENCKNAVLKYIRDSNLGTQEESILLQDLNGCDDQDCVISFLCTFPEFNYFHRAYDYDEESTYIGIHPLACMDKTGNEILEMVRGKLGKVFGDVDVRWIEREMYS